MIRVLSFGRTWKRPQKKKIIVHGLHLHVDETGLKRNHSFCWTIPKGGLGKLVTSVDKTKLYLINNLSREKMKQFEKWDNFWKFTTVRGPLKINNSVYSPINTEFPDFCDVTIFYWFHTQIYWYLLIFTDGMNPVYVFWKT